MKQWLACRIVLFIFTLEKLVLRLDEIAYIAYVSTQNKASERMVDIFSLLDSIE